MSITIDDPYGFISGTPGSKITIKEEEAYKSTQDMQAVAVDQVTDCQNIDTVNKAILPCWGGPSAEEWYGAAQTLYDYVKTCGNKLATTGIELIKINGTFNETDSAAADRAGSMVTSEGGNGEG